MDAPPPAPPRGAVDMRVYHPAVSQTLTYRRVDGTLYMKRVTRPTPGVFHAFLPDKSGTHFTRDDFIPLAYGEESAPYNNTWYFRLGPDMSVTEVADTFGERGQYYGPLAGGISGIVHGRPGGHEPGEGDFSLLDQHVYHSANLVEVPALLPNWLVWSSVRLVNVHPTYTSAYGRREGVWGAGGAHTYANVAEKIFAHGTSGVGPNCDASRPAWALHHPGFVSYWVRILLAPGIGEIEEEILFDERSCAGTRSLGNSSVGYHAFIDEPN